MHLPVKLGLPVVPPGIKLSTDRHTMLTPGLCCRSCCCSCNRPELQHVRLCCSDHQRLLNSPVSDHGQKQSSNFRPVHNRATELQCCLVSAHAWCCNAAIQRAQENAFISWLQMAWFSGNPPTSSPCLKPLPPLAPAFCDALPTSLQHACFTYTAQILAL